MLESKESGRQAQGRLLLSTQMASPAIQNTLYFDQNGLGNSLRWSASLESSSSPATGPTSTVPCQTLSGLGAVGSVWLSLLVDTIDNSDRCHGLGSVSTGAGLVGIGVSVRVGIRLRSLLRLLVERMVGVEVGVELSATAGLVGEELDRVAHVLLNTSFLSVLVVLGARAFSNVKKVDDHGNAERVIPVATQVTDRVRTNVVRAGDVLGGQTIGTGASGGLEPVATPRPLVLLGCAGGGSGLGVQGDFQTDVSAGLTDVGKNCVGELHVLVTGVSADVADGGVHGGQAEDLQQQEDRQSAKGN